MLRKIAAVLAVVVVISMLVGPLANFGVGSSAQVGASNESVQVAQLNSAATTGGGNPVVDGVKPAGSQSGRSVKPIDQPNIQDKLRMMERQRLLEAGQTAEATALAQTGTDRVLVVLVEFAGTDVFTWTAPITPTDPTTGSQWDPLGIADAAEDTGTLGDCSNIITETTTFTYTGPLHNMLERPLSASDRSGDTIWTPDFSKQWFTDFMFGNGVVISYTRQDSSTIYESFLGQSVKDYFSDQSANAYTITGDVIGWVQVPHSTWYYDADECPGARSTSASGVRRGVIPGAGTSRTLVRDALNQVNAISNTIPGFNWANYDLDGDGIIDRLWIVHAGYGEEDSPTLLNRDPVVQGTGVTPAPASFYGESAVWSHSSAVTPPYSVTQNIAAGAYIVMPENGGIGVFAHEYAHNLGADDLYAYGWGETSAGFWALQADDWTGYPIGFEPPAPDPWHLDNWGWLNPYVVSNPNQVYTVTLGQASDFDTNSATGSVYRGAKIALPTGHAPLASQPWQGSYYWWGGKGPVMNSTMTAKDPIVLPSGTITLSFDLAYDIEEEWDFLWVQVSTDSGATWDTITNTNTICAHDPDWIGEEYGFPADLCGAGLGGFSGTNTNFPDPDPETFDLSAFAGQSVLLRFWYMTDWGTELSGPFMDNVAVTSSTTTAFSDDAEAGDAKWEYEEGWIRSNGQLSFTHNYYLQWRNTNANGGYDSALGDPRWRFGPANTGLLVWYNNNFYSDNEIDTYLGDFPSLGPKGRMLVVDSHPEPYRDPNNAFPDRETGNVTSRALMRDAPFTLQDTVGFTLTAGIVVTDTHFPGRPAVSEFSDANTYWPGVEYINPYWRTVDWDASAVVPSKNAYGILPTTYPPSSGIVYKQRGEAGGWYGFLYSDASGSQPGDVNGQYGWHVEVIEEAGDHTWATVRIWNEQSYEVTSSPAALPNPGTHNVTYQIALNNAGTVTQTRQFTYTLDPALTFVSHSWVGGVDLAPTFSYSTTVNPGQTLTFTLVASVTVSASQAQTTVTTSVMHDDLMNPVETTNLVTLLGMYRIHLPLIRR